MSDNVWLSFLSLTKKKETETAATSENIPDLHSEFFPYSRFSSNKAHITRIHTHTSLANSFAFSNPINWNILLSKLNRIHGVWEENNLYVRYQEYHSLSLPPPLLHLGIWIITYDDSFGLMGYNSWSKTGGEEEE